MSSQDSFLNQFRQGSQRETPNPLQVEQNSLPVPTNVPFVAPVNIIPDNLSDIQKFSPLNKLAESLGTGGVGAGGLAAKFQKIAELKKQREDNRNYSQGLVWSADQAGKSKDFLADLTNKSIIPPNQNPMFLLGAQVQGFSTSAAQYRNDLVQARIANPSADPTQLQNQVKQKYSDLVSKAGSPEAAYKFFIEPSQKADEEDQRVFQSYAADGFKKQYHDNVKSALSSVADAGLALYHDGKQDLQTVQRNIQQQFESSIATMAATGIPLGAISESATEAIIDKAKDQGTLQDRLTILNSLKGVRLPGGTLLLSQADADEKFHKAQEQIIQDDMSQNKMTVETNNQLATQNTNPYLNQMVSDAAKGRLQGLSTYLPPKAADMNVNFRDIADLYNKMNSSVTTTVEQSKTNEKVGLITTALKGDPSLTLRLGSQLAGQGLVSAEDVKSSVEVANSIKNHNDTQDKMKLPSAEINEKLKLINPPVPHFGAGRWSGYSDDVALQAIPFDLRQKYKREVVNQIGGFLKQNPGADPVAVNQKLDQIMDNLQPQIHRDYDAIRSKTGDYHSVMAPLGTQMQQQSQKQQQPQFNRAEYDRKYGFATDPTRWEAAKQQFLQKQGPATQWLRDSLKMRNKEEHFNDVWQMYKTNPDLILETFERGGYPTFRNQAKVSPTPHQQRVYDGGSH